MAFDILPLNPVLLFVCASDNICVSFSADVPEQLHIETHSISIKNYLYFISVALAGS